MSYEANSRRQHVRNRQHKSLLSENQEVWASETPIPFLHLSPNTLPLSQRTPKERASRLVESAAPIDPNNEYKLKFGDGYRMLHFRVGTTSYQDWMKSRGTTDNCKSNEEYDTAEDQDYISKKESSSLRRSPIYEPTYIVNRPWLTSRSYMQREHASIDQEKTYATAKRDSESPEGNLGLSKSTSCFIINQETGIVERHLDEGIRWVHHKSIEAEMASCLADIADQNENLDIHILVMNVQQQFDQQSVPRSFRYGSNSTGKDFYTAGCFVIETWLDKLLRDVEVKSKSLHEERFRKVDTCSKLARFAQSEFQLRLHGCGTFTSENGRRVYRVRGLTENEPL